MQMKTFLLLLAVTVLSISFQSCEHEGLSEKENYVEFVITSDTPGAQLYKYTAISEENPQGILYFKDKYEYHYVTTDYTTSIEVGCLDPKVLLTITLYVNHKKVKTVRENRDAILFYRLKGQGFTGEDRSGRGHINTGWEGWDTTIIHPVDTTKTH